MRGRVWMRRVRGIQHHNTPRGLLMRSTHTLASLEVSAATYEEIGALLRNAGWHHVFAAGGIDMTGVLLVREAEVDPTKHCPNCKMPTATELTAHGDSARRFFCVAHCGQKVWEVPFSPRTDDEP